jgi:8-amino-7-oxononanoate synthase
VKALSTDQPPAQTRNQDFDIELSERLDQIRAQGLYRELRPIDSPQSAHIQLEGRSFLNFSSNDYLGLSNHPALKDAAIEAVQRYGAGAAASRLICGSLTPHQRLEDALAAFKNTEAALSFSSGYAAAAGTICALLGKQDIIVVDRLVHACIVDAARLSGAKLRVFAHNDLNDLEQVLRWADRFAPTTVKSGRPKVLIVTETVFSMDGDFAPLRQIVQLKNQYGAWLMVDEAHATGLYGAARRGLADELGVGSQIEIQMGTLGKALGASGGYVCGSRALVDYLVNRARTFIFSTAPVPAAVASATAGVQIAQSHEGARRCKLLWQRVAELRSDGYGENGTISAAILPLMVGDETKAVETAAALRAQGILIPAIRYPTVARGKARLRLTLTADHTSDDVATLRGALARLGFAQPGAD